jgi:uncharacterized protein
MISTKLMNTIINQYQQSLKGAHGLSHWARVYENGQKLAKLTGANRKVVELFAFFHDSKRMSEQNDSEHGLRGAKYAACLKDSLFNLSEHNFNLLYNACANHTKGLTEADITIQVCWDSDRLDLGRAGITPGAEKLCTMAAKNPDIIKWADNRSRNPVVPDFIAATFRSIP